MLKFLVLFCFISCLDPPKNLFYSENNLTFTVQWDENKDESLIYLVIIEYGQNENIKRFTKTSFYEFDDLEKIEANFKEFRAKVFHKLIATVITVIILLFKNF